MQLVKKYGSGQRIQFVYVFLFGFFVGAFFMNFWKNTFLTGSGFLDETMLYQIQSVQIDKPQLLRYLFGKRMSLCAGLVVFSTTYLGIVVTYGSICFMGLASGMLLAAASIRYGMKGIFLLLAGIFPQYILYVPVFWFLFNWCYEICAVMYFPARIYELNLYQNKKKYILERSVRLLLLLTLLMAGLLLECYINPFLLQGILKFF